MEKKSNLIEIKRGQTGRGLLVEQDGYISMCEGQNKKLFEAIKAEGSEGFHCPYPFVLDALFQKHSIENHNGRIYPKEILEREVEKFQQKIQERRAYGELNHPDDSVVDLGRVAMNIIELHWEQHSLVGKLEIITSEGFRRTGICSTMGDQAAYLLLNGLKIGISSRAVGSVEQRFGKMVVGDDLELITWDLVSDPSTPNAWLSEDPKEISMYIENKKKEGEKLFEDLSRFDDWLQIND